MPKNKIKQRYNNENKSCKKDGKGDYVSTMQGDKH